MDKLEPIIKHRFWILLGLSAPLIIYGYYSANAEMNAATRDRKTALDSIYSGVPRPPLANETYSQTLSVINDRYDLEVAFAHQAVWNMSR